MSLLVGYLRKKAIKIGNQTLTRLVINLDANTIKRAERFTTKDGNEYIQVYAGVDKVQEIIDSERSVTSVCSEGD